VDVLARQRNLLDRSTRAVAIVGFVGLVAIGALTMVDALSRHLGLPRIPGFDDYGEVAFAIIIASCFPAGLLHNQNITIGYLGRAFGRRGEAVLDTFGALVTLCFFAFVAVQFVEMTQKMPAAGRTTSTLGIPVAPWWWITTGLFFVALPVQVWVVGARVAEVVTRRDVITEDVIADSEADQPPLGVTEGLTDTALDRERPQ